MAGSGGLQNAGIRAVIEGVDKYVSDLKRINTGTDALDKNNRELERSSGGLGKTMVGTAAGFALADVAVRGVAGAFKFGLGNAVSFEKGIDAVGAVSGATEKELGQLSTTALRIGADTAFSAGQAVAAMEILASNGITVADIMDGAADATAALAAAGGVSLPLAADTVSTAMAVWGMRTDEMSEAVNRLAGAANVSRFGVEDMSQAIAAGGGAAAASGVEFGDFTTTIAAIAPYFSSGSDAGTSLKSMLVALTPKSKEAEKAMRELGIITADGANQFYDATGKVKSMADITDVLHNATSGLSEQQRIQALSTIFGTDAMRAAAGMAKLTGAEFTAMDKKMKETDAAVVAKQRMENLAGQVDALKGSLETVGIQIGTKVIPVLNELATKAIALVNAFGEMPKGSQNIILMGVAMLGVIPAGLKMISVLKDLVIAQDAAGKMSMTSGAKLGLWVAAVTAATLAVDILLEKTSGHGLMERVFGDIPTIDAASAAVRDFNAAVLAGGAGADKTQIAMDALNKTSKEFVETEGKLTDDTGKVNAALGVLAMQGGAGSAAAMGLGAAFEFGGHRLLGFNVGASAATDQQKKLAAEVKVAADAMAANNTSVGKLKEAYDKLPPALQKVFDESTGVVAAYGKLNDASERARLKAQLEDAQRRTTTQGMEEAKPVIVDTRGEFEKLADNYDDAKDAAKGLKEAFEQLMGQFATFNPVVAQATAENGFLKKKIEDLKASAENLTPAQQAMIDKWEAVIETNSRVIESHGRSEEALKTAETALKNYMGDAGLGNLLMKLKELKVPEQEQIALLEGTTFAMGTLAKEGVPAALQAFGELKSKLDPAVWAAIAREIGPKFVATITAGYEGPEMLELLAASTAIGFDTTDATAEGMAANAAVVRLAAKQVLLDAETNNVETARNGGVHLGTQMGEGMAAGIAAMAASAAVTSAARRLVRNALDAGQEEARVQSPSRLFADELGRPIAEGVGVGIAEGSLEAVREMQRFLINLDLAARAGHAQMAASSGAGIAQWAQIVQAGIATGSQLSTTAIQQMFLDVNAAIQNSGMDSAATMELQTLATSLMSGFQQTGSLSVAALQAMFAQMAAAAATGAASVAAAGTLPPMGASSVGIPGNFNPFGAGVMNGGNGYQPTGSVNQGGGGSGLAPGESGFVYQYLGGGQYGWMPYVEPIEDPNNPGGFYQPASGGNTPVPNDLPVGVPPGTVVSRATGTPYVLENMLALLHKGEAVIPASLNTQGPGSMVSAPGLGGGGGTTLTIDMRGATLTGTLAENEALMMRVARRVLNDDLGRGSVLAGVSLR